jgi:hypothetical protein
MPNFLSKAWGAANEPLIPEEPVRQLQESMTTPHLDENPWWARAKGFGAGALEGLRGQSSPMNIASNLAMLVPGAGLIGKGAQAARGGAALAEAPQAVEGLGRMGGAMSGLMHAAPAAEFAPVGGEAAWNATRPVAAAIPDPAVAAYERILQQLPTGVEHNSQAIADMARPGTQEMLGKLHNEANPVFRKMQGEGAFSGQR